jgi:predicted PurR-regulated permease PerM
VLLGAELAGFWGILIAIPVAGIVQFGLKRWVVPRLQGPRVADAETADAAGSPIA